jgi:dienelactone hydrolase
VAPSTVDAQLRAAVVLSGVVDSAAVAAAVRIVTAEPQLADEPVAGIPALVVRPGRGTTWPALVLLNGVTAEGRRHPRVRRLALALARAGFLVCVPDPSGLARGPIGAQVLRDTTAVVDAVSARTDVRGARVGLVGISFGATLALLVAEEPSFAHRITVVAGIGPHVDFVSALRLAATGDAPPLLALVSARSLLVALPRSAERDELIARLDEVGDDDPEPLRSLTGSTSAVAELLLNRDPGRFESLYAALPEEARAELERLSPLAGADRLRAPVELAVPPADKYVPLAETRAFVRAATGTRVRLTVTAALDHAVPRLSVRELGDLVRFDAWVVRALRAAGRP